ncbi:MetQ/NlpA family ABC transporter substrate-binding protein [Aquibacillus rhizosphaerae]|uniref:Lipoprotein n=1 Tax=Aquibacillus rhizosphaerae TaxID=3051431 RepID=A0ABT7L264_9BACI|nr:MetQ/NlpA family ABC transporter substrate-binding protein [Aquibacillus sp. LR5S19]MDL4839933.1 MetQ/NlpA family ABC transporter substrate-binding protein [Aquibacillus sp. LR5S19]
MKKILNVLLAALFILVITACGTNDEENDTASENAGENTAETEGTEETEEPVEIKVGATSVPHAEVLEQAKPLLAEEGIELVVEEYQDYILPNQDLSDGRIDANYFQHIPYFNSEVEEKGYDFVNLGSIHVEPMAVYSQNITSVDDIPEGTEVIISRSVADHGRILALFESQGLITLDADVEKVDATVNDIVENPLNLTFSPDFDAAFLPEAYDKEEDALVAINTNYAIEAGLSIAEDSLFVEGEDSPYPNIIAARAEDENNESLLKLVEVLQSEEIQNYIIETYNGEVVPVSESN